MSSIKSIVVHRSKLEDLINERNKIIDLIKDADVPDSVKHKFIYGTRVITCKDLFEIRFISGGADHVRGTHPSLFDTDDNDVENYYRRLVDAENSNVFTFVALTLVTLAREVEMAYVLAEPYESCSMCAHKGNTYEIMGSTCYLCRRNPVDNRIDWFEFNGGKR